MLGHFLKKVELEGYTPAGELRPGMAVVGVSDARQLERYGIAGTIQFAIVSDNGTLIYQSCLGNDINSCGFSIQDSSVQFFKKQYGELYIYHIENELPPEQVLQQAKDRMRKQLDTPLTGLRSYVGDDFVDECLTGGNVLEQIEQDASAGQHWQVPLNIDVKLVARQLKAHPKIQRMLKKKILNPTVHEGTHHGIALEAGQMLHFSTCRTPDDSNRLKLDPQTIFHNISHTSMNGTAVVYKEETTEMRLLSRNRAVWWLFHAEAWGEYCIFSNNCEHFSRYCREGKKRSIQVAKAFVQFIISVAPMAIPYLGSLRYLTPILTQVLRNVIISRKNTSGTLPS
ncbi:MAG: lecithin retinol acyltransferase family protein [Akkermansia sp.]|nr:lecithin retinol acyltransferase family protein [Akkermansia sp.]